MTVFIYNNAKNVSISHMPFKFNCKYHSCVSYKENFDSYSKSKIVKELSSKLQNLIVICPQNVHYI